MTSPPNIVHLVLARLPDAPPGTKGISLFVVPKFLPDADGRPGAPNDVRCTGIERKLGIHASPTCTMLFGEQDACTGWLVGPPHGGMRAMFTMMNHARIGVGVQGVAIAERATQGAVAYARDRRQGAGAIIDYPDVRRMLMTMRALTQAARGLACYNAAAVDRAQAGDAAARALADLLTPVTKAWATDIGVEVASLGIQVHGGMGYVEETGAAQHLRDARIAPIYEGTNGIQAMDLIGRKLRADGGAAMAGLIGSMAAEARALAAAGPDDLARAVTDAAALLREATDVALALQGGAIGAAATPYLRLAGLATGAWLLARQARYAEEGRRAGGDGRFLAAKIATARFFAAQILPQAAALLPAIRAGAEPLHALDAADFAR